MGPTRHEGGVIHHRQDLGLDLIVSGSEGVLRRVGVDHAVNPALVES